MFVVIKLVKINFYKCHLYAIHLYLGFQAYRLSLNQRTSAANGFPQKPKKGAARDRSALRSGPEDASAWDRIWGGAVRSAHRRSLGPNGTGFEGAACREPFGEVLFFFLPEGDLWQCVGSGVCLTFMWEDEISATS